MPPPPMQRRLVSSPLRAPSTHSSSLFCSSARLWNERDSRRSVCEQNQSAPSYTHTTERGTKQMGTASDPRLNCDSERPEHDTRSPTMDAASYSVSPAPHSERVPRTRLARARCTQARGGGASGIPAGMVSHTTVSHPERRTDRSRHGIEPCVGWQCWAPTDEASSASSARMAIKASASRSRSVPSDTPAT